MPRPRKGEPTRLGASLRATRGDRSIESVASEFGMSTATLSRIERGKHTPSVDTALALARWLGWSVEQVLAAARTPTVEEETP